MRLRKAVCLMALLLWVSGFTACVTYPPGLRAAPEAAWEPFTGSVHNYRFMHQGRDRAWEEDVIEFARFMLFSHPSIRYATMITVHNLDRNMRHVGRTSLLEEHVYLRPDGLREEFLYRINELIPKIPDMKDYEIVYSLLEINTLLRDTHTRIVKDYYSYKGWALFNVVFLYFNDGFYSAWFDNDNIVSGRLAAINNVPASEIFEIMSSVTPIEPGQTNEQAIRSRALLLSSRGFLAYAGVLDIADETAEFTFSDGEGNIFIVTKIIFESSESNTVLPTLLDESFRFSRHNLRDSLSFSPDNEFYWYEYLSEYSMMYVRYIWFLEMAHYTFTQFTRDIIDAVNNAGGVERFVVDLRGNNGGELPQGFLNLVSWLYDNQELAGSVYVLIDHGTYSAGVTGAAVLRRSLEHSLLVGEPAGQPPNFLARATAISRLPNSGLFTTESQTGILIGASQAYIISWPGPLGHQK